MLCRALLVAAVLSYVLCVLLLSGVQKDDIDGGTLRKLQRHNVNIDDINDRHVQERCLGKTNIPINLTTLQARSITESTTTGKTVTAEEIPIETYKNVGSPAADSIPLQKIVEYLENKQKDERRNVLESNDNIRQSTLEPSLFTIAPSRSSSHQLRRKTDEEPSTESAQTIMNNDEVDATNNKAVMNKELEKLMKLWQTSIAQMSDRIKQESTTMKIINDDVISNNTKDIEYITKIVAEIMSKRQFNDVKNSTEVPKRNFNSIQTIPAAPASNAQSKNETFLPSTYLLNNCRLSSLYANKASKDKKGVIESLKNQFDVNSPIANINHNDEYMICKKIESTAKEASPPNQRIDDYTVNYILNTLKKGREGVNIMDSESAKYENPIENQPKNGVFIPWDPVKNRNNYKDNFNMLNNGNSKIKSTALENQSNGIFFNQQNGQIKISDTYKPIFNQPEYESAKAFETGLENQPKTQYLEHQNDRVKSSPTSKEKQNNYSRFVEENKASWAKYVANLRGAQEPKSEEEPPQRTLKLPILRYKEAKQDGNGLEEEYKRWFFMYQKPSNKHDSTMETKQSRLLKLNNIADDREKPTNIINSIQYDPNHGNQYKRLRLYGGVSEQFGPKIKGKRDEVLVKPKNQQKIINTIYPGLENAYKKTWSPYFEAVNNNNSVIQTEDHVMTKNNQEPILVDPEISPLIQRNDREISPELDGSKKYADSTGWYPNKTPYVMEDRNDNQFRLKGGQKINQAGSPLPQYKINTLPDAEYKSDWAYFRNKQIKKQRHNMEEERDEETEYYINSKSTQQNDYQDPPRPYEANVKKLVRDKDNANNRYSKNAVKRKLSNERDKKETTKFPIFPPNVIKDIANSVKEIVLRDLKTTTNIPTTSTTPSTTTTPTTTTTTSTTTPTTTSTSTARTTTSTTRSTTTEGTLTTPKDPLKIQDASKALEKIMEIFEKISSIKDKMVILDNVKTDEGVSYDTTTIKTTTEKRKAPETVQKMESPVQYKPESPVLYIPQSAQLRPENRIPYDPQPVQFKTENHAPYIPEAMQLNAANRMPYNPLQLKAQNSVLYEPQPGHHKAENRLPYDPQNLQQNAEHRLPYNPLPLQIKSENNMPYDPQIAQLRSENRVPYDAQLLQRKPDNRVPYDYGAKSPYYHSKIEYSPYLDKEVLEPVTPKTKPKKAPRTHAITVQTNSGEIAPLKITVKKPLVQNIVLTTKAPVTEDNNSDETFKYRKPINSANQHKSDNNRDNEASDAREKKQFVTRHTHRDTYMDMPKSRKIKKEQELNEDYKPRDMQAIERFHEKLERGEVWPRYEEEKIAQRMQRPLVKKTTYDDTHFRNFLQTQQKVNAMLERILGTGKNKQVSTEVL